MTKLTPTQRDLLCAASVSSDGALPPDTATKATLAALTKRGFISGVEQDGQVRFTITGDGRAAVQPSAPPNGDPATVESVAPGKTPKGKLGLVIDLLRRPQGAELEELMSATGWQAHSVRGVMSGAIKKKLGLAVLSIKVDGARVYRVGAETQA